MLKIEVIGNIGFDATIKQINNRDVLSFSIAHSERRNGEETTQWVNCLYYTGNPERLQPYLTKGKNVHVRGNMSASTYTTRDGVVKVDISCYVSEFDFCGNRGESQSTGTTTQSAPVAQPAQPAPVQQPAAPVATQSSMFMPNGDPNDDLPF